MRLAPFFIVASLLSPAAHQTARAEPPAPRAQIFFEEQLRDGVDWQVAMAEATKVWFDEVQNKQYPPGPMLNRELQRLFGRNAKQFDLVTGELIDPLAQPSREEQLARARERQLAEAIAADARNRATRPPRPAPSAPAPKEVAKATINSPDVFAYEPPDVPDVFASPDENTRPDREEKVADSTNEGPQGFRNWTTSDGKTFRGRFQYKGQDPSTSKYIFSFLDEQDKWVNVPESQFDTDTYLELLETQPTKLKQHVAGGRSEAGGVGTPKTQHLVYACLGRSLQDCKNNLGQPTRTDLQNGFVDFVAEGGVTVRCWFKDGITEQAKCEGVGFKPAKPGDQTNEWLRQNAQGQRWSGPQQRSNDFSNYLEWKRDDGAMAMLDDLAKMLFINSPARVKSFGGPGAGRR